MMNNDTEHSQDELNQEQVAGSQGSPLLTAAVEKPGDPSVKKTIVIYVLSSMSVVMTLLFGIFLFMSWQTTNSLLAQQSASLDTLKATISKTDSSVGALHHTMATQREELQTQWLQLQQQHAALQVLESKGTEHDQQWILKEAEYLTRLANFSVAFQRNIPVSIELLFSADQQIASLKDPSLEEVRKVLSDNITALEAVDIPDTEGILLKLSSLSQQVSELEDFSTYTAKKGVITEKSPIGTNPTVAATEDDKANWREGLSKTWGKLRGLVIIRSNKNPNRQIWDPALRAYHDEHMQLLLNQAQWALLYRKNNLYGTSLNQANEWLQKYYDPESSKTQGMSKELQQLAILNIDPTLPDISRTLTTIVNVEKHTIQQPVSASERVQPQSTEASKNE